MRIMVTLLITVLAASPPHDEHGDTSTMPTLPLPAPEPRAALPSREARIAYLAGARGCVGTPPLTTSVIHRADSFVEHPDHWLDTAFVYRCAALMPRKAVSDGYLQTFWLDLTHFCQLANLPAGHGLTVQLGDGMPHLANTSTAPGSSVFTKARLISTRCGSLLPLNSNRHWSLLERGGPAANSSKHIQHPFGHVGRVGRNAAISFTPLVPWRKKVRICTHPLVQRWV